ncbi:MAG TPA: succinyl-diaminopimelate desuccinylase [Acidimicrobiales bacterium]|nr:succinyl-diaminopimelate desuccinylase [Acidimicrobiales bacterium]
MTDLLGQQLLQATSELVAVPSVSHQEQALADLVEDRLRAVGGLEVVRLGDNVVARTRQGRPTRLVVAGHLDTVPPAGNGYPRQQGDILWGLGSADMKGGLAVMLRLAAHLPEPSCDVTYAFYAGEEVERAHNGLLRIDRDSPDLLKGDAAILGEPTGARVEAGCQGVLKLDVTIGGRRAHTARPWMGANAIHRLAPILGAVARYRPRRPVLADCRYEEALQAVAVAGGVAANVVPDQARLHLNHRFAPDRDAAAAEAAVRALIEPLLDAASGDRLEVVDSAPAAPPGLEHPLLGRLREASGQPPRAKLGWTDVAFFAERGIPAVNFGPGDPEVAHTADERVEASQLAAAYRALHLVLGGSPGPGVAAVMP